MKGGDFMTDIMSRTAKQRIDELHLVVDKLATVNDTTALSDLSESLNELKTKYHTNALDKRINLVGQSQLQYLLPATNNFAIKKNANTAKGGDAKKKKKVQSKKK